MTETDSVLAALFAFCLASLSSKIPGRNRRAVSILSHHKVIGGGAVEWWLECPTWDGKVPGSIPGDAKKCMHVCKYLPLLSCVLCYIMYDCRFG